MKVRVEATDGESLWRLMNALGQQIYVGDRRTTFRGDEVIVVGGTPPHNEGSTGRVEIKFVGHDSTQHFFPGVINARWELILDPKRSL